MKEYRIVATREAEHINGGRSIIENTFPWTEKSMLITTFKTKAEAKQVLASIKNECAEFDKKTHERLGKNSVYTIAYTQTNIRIQSRDVTEWKDE